MGYKVRERGDARVELVTTDLRISTQDLNLIDAEKHQGAPNDIEPLRGDKKNPQRNGTLQLFCHKAGTVMTYEH